MTAPESETWRYDRVTVGVAIPSIPPRSDLLERSLRSVLAQTFTAHQISVVVDTEGHGAAWTRNRAWRALTTDYVAFLDDDDEMGPNHLQVLVDSALATSADMTFPWFNVQGGADPFPHHFGREWSLDDPHQTTITALWKRSALELIDGFQEAPQSADREGNRFGEDLDAVVRLARAGGTVHHVAKRTWTWHHHRSNLSGLPWPDSVAAEDHDRRMRRPRARSIKQRPRR